MENPWQGAFPAILHVVEAGQHLNFNLTLTPLTLTLLCYPLQHLHRLCSSLAVSLPRMSHPFQPTTSLSQPATPGPLRSFPLMPSGPLPPADVGNVGNVGSGELGAGCRMHQALILSAGAVPHPQQGERQEWELGTAQSYTLTAPSPQQQWGLPDPIAGAAWLWLSDNPARNGLAKPQHLRREAEPELAGACADVWGFFLR